MREKLILSLLGCPTHVGIDLRLDIILAIDARLPHTRGDRPSTYRMRVEQQMAAPHTWG